MAFGESPSFMLLMNILRYFGVDDVRGSLYLFMMNFLVLLVDRRSFS